MSDRRVEELMAQEEVEAEVATEEDQDADTEIA